MSFDIENNFNFLSCNIKDNVKALIKENDNLTILSPYLSDNEVIADILKKNSFKLTLILNFSKDTLKQGSIDLSVIKKLLDKNHIIRINNNNHAKVYISSNEVIIGSANFTKIGLEDEFRQEACIKFSKELYPEAFNECIKFVEKIVETADLLIKKYSFDTEFIERANELKLKFANNKNLMNKSFTELLKSAEKSTNNVKVPQDSSSKKKFTKVEKAYNIKYFYPKTYNELEPGLRFEFVDYSIVINEFKKINSKDKRIKFINEELFIKNQGYRIPSSSSTIDLSIMDIWVRRNGDKLINPLKGYKEFLIDRSLQLLQNYKEKYNIEPITGDFKILFKRLIDKNLLNADYFNVQFNRFEEEHSIDKIKTILDRLDEFIIKNKRAPESGARRNVLNTSDINKKRELKDEGKLGDDLLSITKKFYKPLYFPEIKKLIKIRFSKFYHLTQNKIFLLPLTNIPEK